MESGSPQCRGCYDTAGAGTCRRGPLRESDLRSRSAITSKKRHVVVVRVITGSSPVGSTSGARRERRYQFCKVARLPARTREAAGAASSRPASCRRRPPTYVVARRSVCAGKVRSRVTDLSRRSAA